jgi:hypothetical protein
MAMSPGANANSLLQAATKHIGTSRTAEFRNQLDAIAKATPSAEQDADWNGRGDG